MTEITIFNCKQDYRPEQLIRLQQAGEKLLVCEQGDVRTLEETRIMVACKRLQQEDNFKIVAGKPPKVVKERKPKKLTKKNFFLILAKIEDGLEVTTDENVDFEHSKQFWGN